jgi:hypothetical protein
VTWRLKARTAERIDAAIARQRRGTHVSAATNKRATIGDAVFSVLPLLARGAVNTCLWQRINRQQQKNCWKRYFLCGPCQGYIAKTNGKN